MKTFRQLVEEHFETKVTPENNDELMSELLWDKVVHEGDRDTHRWFIVVEKVIELDNRFFLLYDYEITGDGCMSDMDLEYDLVDDVQEVYPYTIKTTAYSTDEKYKIQNKIKGL